MKVYSGDCCLCDAGIPTGQVDFYGMHLLTGDIVVIQRVFNAGTDIETASAPDGLTVVCAVQYENILGIAPRKIIDYPKEFYVMGIKNSGFSDPVWRIARVKGWQDVINGENWSGYGFNYRQE